jgi:hypothetical protein
MGPEAVQITGGTCTSGSPIGSITFSASNSHSAGYTVQSNDSGISEAISAAIAAGVNEVYVTAGSYAAHGPIMQLPSGFYLHGASRQSIITLSPATPYVPLISAIGTLTNSTTTATNLAFSNRANIVTDTINFTSTAGYAVGDVVDLFSGIEATYGNVFVQFNTISAISAPAVTFRDPIVIPLDNTLGSHSISKLNPVSHIVIEGLVLDGGGIGYNRSNANQFYGVLLSYVSYCRINDVYFRNWVASAGLMMAAGYENSVTNVETYNSGSGGYDSISLYSQTNLQASNLRVINASGFGIQFAQNVFPQVSNVLVQSAGQVYVGRAIKLAATAYGSFVNVTANRASANGLAISQGSYKNQFKNVVALDNKNSEGVWFSSQDNEFNLIDGAYVCGNSGQGIILFSGDHDNIIRNFQTCGQTANDQVIVFGTNNNNTLDSAQQFRSFAYSSSATWSVPNNAWTNILWDTNVYDFGIHSTSANTDRFATPVADAGAGGAPSGGMYLLSCWVRFSPNATGTRGVGIQRLGASPSNGQYVALQQYPANSDLSNSQQIMATAMVQSYGGVSGGEYFVCQAFQNSGGPLNANGGSTTASGMNMTRLR